MRTASECKRFGDVEEGGSLKLLKSLSLVCVRVQTVARHGEGDVLLFVSMGVDGCWGDGDE